MKRRSSQDKKQQKTIALERIHRLFELAENYALKNRMPLADRYVTIARNISMKYLVPIPKEYKRRFCKHCYKYLLPGVNARVRIHKGKIVTSCVRCKNMTRMPLHARSLS